MTPPWFATPSTPRAPGKVPARRARASALARDRHRLHPRRCGFPLPAPLPPDEEGCREDDGDGGDVHVEAYAAELVGGVDPKRLDPEPADAVDEHVEREQVAGSEREAALDREQHERRAEAPERLVQEGRVEGGRVEVLLGPVLDVDLKAPREVGRLTEELLVPPVPEATDPLRDEQSRRRSEEHTS